MRILVSVMAFAIALAWSGAGEAQSKKSGVRSGAAVQQKVQRPAKTVVTRSTGQNCAGYAWWGCTGWDPDPNIRTMLARDVGGDD
jgi:hypothetical protein